MDGLRYRAKLARPHPQERAILPFFDRIGAPLFVPDTAREGPVSPHQALKIVFYSDFSQLFKAIAGDRAPTKTSPQFLYY